MHTMTVLSEVRGTLPRNTTSSPMTIQGTMRARPPGSKLFTVATRPAAWYPRRGVPRPSRATHLNRAREILFKSSGGIIAAELAPFGRVSRMQASALKGETLTRTRAMRLRWKRAASRRANSGFPLLSWEAKLCGTSMSTACQLCCGMRVLEGMLTGFSKSTARRTAPGPRRCAGAWRPPGFHSRSTMRIRMRVLRPPSLPAASLGESSASQSSPTG
mmetsp:Transcript_61602/g.133343  ORF Transcript_61602/g.133343 Transcript_61602/m.133343 type:complete len:217 (+) Transcript_61602:480-1130(+)